MKTAAVILGTLALTLPVPVRSEPLSAHLTNSVEVNLANDVPIRLLVQADLSPIKKYEQEFVCREDRHVELYEPFALSFHVDHTIPLFDQILLHSPRE